MSLYHSFIKPYMFRLDAEKAHYKTVSLFRVVLRIPFGKSIIKSLYNYQSPKLELTLFGLNFKNPVGLAAGFDKDGKFYKEMSTLGFGFIEIGTVTPKPQDGNPKPRLFRLKEDEGLINRMGFNNDGVDAMIERLKKFKPKDVIIGGNIGKNKVTPNNEAINDYVICFEKLFDYVDYFVVNVSSPNTPGLRDLQDKSPLTAILSKLMILNNEKPKPKPILLKIAPDLTDSQLDDIIDIIEETKIDGVIATNTTISREDLKTSQERITEIGNGGLSGKPVKARSTEVISYLHKKSNGAFPIIGVGGIDGPKAVKEKMDAGASLVQVYSGFIYRGPELVRNINKVLAGEQKKS